MKHCMWEQHRHKCVTPDEFRDGNGPIRIFPNVSQKVISKRVRVLDHGRSMLLHKNLHSVLDKRFGQRFGKCLGFFPRGDVDFFSSQEFNGRPVPQKPCPVPHHCPVIPQRVAPNSTSPSSRSPSKAGTSKAVVPATTGPKIPIPANCPKPPAPPPCKPCKACKVCPKPKPPPHCPKRKPRPLCEPGHHNNPGVHKPCPVCSLGGCAPPKIVLPNGTDRYWNGTYPGEGREHGNLFFAAPALTPPSTPATPPIVLPSPSFSPLSSHSSSHTLNPDPSRPSWQLSAERPEGGGAMPLATA